jgi:glycerol-3-phosphate dehydrogenase (NAD+)
MSIRSLKKVVVIGAGNWGTVVAKIVAENVCKAPTKFSSTVSLWTHQETVNDRLLTDIINTTRVNEKYLPGVVLPTNIVSEACLKTAITGASLLVFVCPHQFVDRILAQIKESSHLLGEEPMAISLIKGLLEPSKIEKKLGLISSHIKSQLNLSSINVLMV